MSIVLLRTRKEPVCCKQPGSFLKQTCKVVLEGSKLRFCRMTTLTTPFVVIRPKCQNMSEAWNLCFDEAMEERVEERDAEEYRFAGIFMEAVSWKMSCINIDVIPYRRKNVMLALLPFTGVRWHHLKNSCSQVYHPTPSASSRHESVVRKANLASSWIFLSGLVSKSPFCLIIFAVVSSQTSILVEIMIGDHGSNWCNYIFQSSHYQLHLSSHHMYCKCVSVGWWLFLQKTGNCELGGRCAMLNAPRPGWFAWFSFFSLFPFFPGHFLICRDLWMFIDDRLTEDHRMHRASEAFAEFYSLAAFFAWQKFGDCIMVASAWFCQAIQEAVQRKASGGFNASCADDLVNLRNLCGYFSWMWPG